ncbi:serine hydrolase domain-containing protein [Mangrovicoccus algicola]|uniref:Beta-lactamase family protein n=1 Tax=Mangrovicoccus algicola TaxID=2771008 RepID=A0A8J6YSF5_9RHOB|nr:serine hydrolase domain-containing protein [Mangrovicoccus algicola]MBE3636872.1 beta-lactamase family protein [Mangrovicoccus algicola]
MLTRRACLALPALIAASRLAAQSPWDAVSARAAQMDQLHSVMVAQEGRIVLARRVRGPALDRPANVKSVSKTLVATLAGTAIDRGEIPGLDATIGALAPGLVPPRADPRVPRLTVENLITMQAGLERTSGANYGAWVSSPDWVADALSRPFVAEPGACMLYSTGSYHVLGAILAEVTGESLLELARNRLGRPLDMPFAPWVADPQGYYLGGNDMATSPEGLLRFAEAIRQGGGDVVSRRWVEDSFRPRTRSPYSGLDYGLGWFLGRPGGTRLALARGYGGQIAATAPDLGLSLVITSDPTRPARSQGYFGDLMALIEQAILPAARAA